MGGRPNKCVAAIVPDSATVEDAQFTMLEDDVTTVWLWGRASRDRDRARRAKLYTGRSTHDTLVALGAEPIGSQTWVGAGSPG